MKQRTHTSSSQSAARASYPDTLPVVVIGAGPVGLAAAAHLFERGVPFLVLEAGSQVGAAIRAWGHIRTFTPWQFIIDPVAEKLLAPKGWSRPEATLAPLGQELVEHYLEPLASLLVDHIRLGTRVLAVSRDGLDKSRSLDRDKHPFLLRITDSQNQTSELLARAVIDASGTWEQPNPLGSAGLGALGSSEAAAFLVGALPDVLGAERSRFAGRRTLVVGSGHSAANTLLNLGRLAELAPGTEILWAIRGRSATKTYGGEGADELAQRAQLGAQLRHLVESGAVELVAEFATTKLEAEAEAETVAIIGASPTGERRLSGVHNVVVATGFRPDLSLLSELRLELDPGLESSKTLGPLIDPAYHSCGSVAPHGHRELAHPEPGLYIVGMKSYGRAPTFLITTGNEQVRSVVASLAGDVAAADEIQLVLPETGVCSALVGAPDTEPSGGCCASGRELGTEVAEEEAHELLVADELLRVGEACCG